MTKLGVGTVTLSQNEQYGGTTTINAGVLANGTNNALLSTSSLVVNGTYDLSGFNQTLAGSIAWKRDDHGKC